MTKLLITLLRILKIYPNGSNVVTSNLNNINFFFFGNCEKDANMIK
jgi:hypothetical protein